jgi:hypothetical protein
MERNFFLINNIIWLKNFKWWKFEKKVFLDICKRKYFTDVKKRKQNSWCIKLITILHNPQSSCAWIKLRFASLYVNVVICCSFYNICMYFIQTARRICCHMSSFNERSALGLIANSCIEFVKYPCLVPLYYVTYLHVS